MEGGFCFLRFKLSENFLHCTVNSGTILRVTKPEVHNSRDVPRWVTEIMTLSFMNHNMDWVAFFNQQCNGIC